MKIKKKRLLKALIKAAVLAVQAKSTHDAPANAKAVSEAVHLKQAARLEDALTDALKPLFSRQIQSTLDALQKLGEMNHDNNVQLSQIFNPRQWDTELVQRCAPPLASEMGKGMFAQLKLMGIDTKKLKKSVKTAKYVAMDQEENDGGLAVPMRFESPAKKPPKEQSDACPHCGARQERGDNGNCNRCGKPWPEKSIRRMAESLGACVHCGSTLGTMGDGSCQACGKSPADGTKSFSGVKISTALQWIQDHPFVQPMVDEGLQEVTFQTPMGPVEIGFSLEMPEWMQKRVKETLNESFDQDYWAKINDTTADDIQEILEQASTEGWSIAEMASAMEDKLGSADYPDTRGRLIGRTESGNALNSARVAAADDFISRLPTELAEMVKKTWQSVLGRTTRLAHANLDGVPADLQGLWNLNGVLVRWPGDINLPAFDRANCQCTVVTVFGMVEEEAQKLRDEYVERVAEYEKSVWVQIKSLADHAGKYFRNKNGFIGYLKDVRGDWKSTFEMRDGSAPDQFKHFHEAAAEYLPWPKWTPVPADPNAVVMNLDPAPGKDWAGAYMYSKIPAASTVSHQSHEKPTERPDKSLPSFAYGENLEKPPEPPVVLKDGIGRPICFDYHLESPPQILSRKYTIIKKEYDLWKKSEEDWFPPEWVKSAKKEFSSTQFNIADGGYTRTQGSPLPVLESLSKEIPDDLLHAKGRETLFHVTVKFGLHTESSLEVGNIVRGFGPVSIILGKTSVFKCGDQASGEGFDVVKVDVEGDDIRRLNQLISGALEHTDTHPAYHPHITLAYVKPGAGEQFAGRSDVNGMEMIFHTLIFSDKTRNHTRISI